MKWELTSNEPLEWRLVDTPVPVEGTLKYRYPGQFHWRLEFPTGRSLEGSGRSYINAMKKVERILLKISSPTPGKGFGIIEGCLE
jgi:hypothetical protein